MIQMIYYFSSIYLFDSNFWNCIQILCINIIKLLFRYYLCIHVIQLFIGIVLNW